MKKTTLDHIITCANMQLKKSLDLLKESENMWNTPLDLKLHDASMMHEYEKTTIYFTTFAETFITILTSGVLTTWKYIPTFAILRTISAGRQNFT